MELEALNDQVLVACADVTVIGGSEIARLKAMARSSPTGRARICAHCTIADPLHEMLIALVSGRYIRPHAHQGKSESFHMIEGGLTIVLFDDAGAIRRLVDLSADGNGALFYRLSTKTFHTVVPWGDMAVFHETTNGPFDPRDTLFPTWAPEESDVAAARQFHDLLLTQLDSSRHSNQSR
jgi:cupin fold WbuC family metalloprotein